MAMTVKVFSGHTTADVLDEKGRKVGTVDSLADHTYEARVYGRKGHGDSMEAAVRDAERKKNPIGHEAAPKYESDLEDVILGGIADALHVSAWADAEEEAGRTYPGMELTEIAPPRTEAAETEALRIAEAYKIANKASLRASLTQATIADQAEAEKTSKPIPVGALGRNDTWEDRVAYAKEFGWYIGMQALGHGVAWDDDHASFPHAVPRAEFHYFDPAEYGGEKKARKRGGRKSNPIVPVVAPARLSKKEA